MKKSIVSLLAIILGLIIIAFPMFGIISAQFIIGVSIILLSIFLLIIGISEIDYSPLKSVLNIFLGIIILILGLILLFNPDIFAFLAALTIYLAGILLIIVGLITLIGNRQTHFGFWNGVIGVILGVIYIIFGTYAKNPFILGSLIGVWLIITGILRFIED